ncbi:Gram-negative porin [compost metagenome]
MTKRRLTLPAVGPLACALFIGSGHAQSATSVTLYGLVDTGIEFLNHAGANGSGSQYRISSGNVTGSRWGIRGKEGLGNDLDAVFVLESGFNSDTGMSGQGGRLFGRQAYVGLQGQWGLISLAGR